MDARAEKQGQYLGDRPYSPTDIVNYDVSSSDESTSKIKTRSEKTSNKSSSEDSGDSSDDSSSSWEYRWEEAKPPKPPFQPFVTSVNVGKAELPAVKRKLIAVVPLKSVLVILFPHQKRDDIEDGIRKLDIYELSKFEADLLTKYLEGLRSSGIKTFTVDGSVYYAEFSRGEVACSYKSLKENYDSIVKDLSLKSPINGSKLDSDHCVTPFEIYTKIGKKMSTTGYDLAVLPKAVSLESSKDFVDAAKDGHCMVESSDVYVKELSTGSKNDSQSRSFLRNSHNDVNLNMPTFTTVGTFDPIADSTKYLQLLEKEQSDSAKKSTSVAFSDSHDQKMKQRVVLKHLLPRNETSESEDDILKSDLLNCKEKYAMSDESKFKEDIFAESEIDAANCDEILESSPLKVPKMKKPVEVAHKNAECLHMEQVKNATAKMSEKRKSKWKSVINSTNLANLQCLPKPNTSSPTDCPESAKSGIRIVLNKQTSNGNRSICPIFEEISDDKKKLPLLKEDEQPVIFPDKAQCRYVPSFTPIKSPPNVNVTSPIQPGFNEMTDSTSEWTVTDSYVCDSPETCIKSKNSVSSEKDPSINHVSINCNQRISSNRVKSLVYRLPQESEEPVACFKDGKDKSENSSRSIRDKNSQSRSTDSQFEKRSAYHSNSPHAFSKSDKAERYHSSKFRSKKYSCDRPSKHERHSDYLKSVKSTHKSKSPESIGRQALQNRSSSLEIGAKMNKRSHSPSPNCRKGFPVSSNTKFKRNSIENHDLEKKHSKDAHSLHLVSQKSYGKFTLIRRNSGSELLKLNDQPSETQKNTNEQNVHCDLDSDIDENNLLHRLKESPISSHSPSVLAHRPRISDRSSRSDRSGHSSRSPSIDYKNRRKCTPSPKCKSYNRRNCSHHRYSSSPIRQLPKPSYPWAMDYSKLKFTYDSALYSPVSSAEDYFDSGESDTRGSPAASKKVLHSRSVRDEMRLRSKPQDSPSFKKSADRPRCPTVRLRKVNDSFSERHTSPKMLSNFKLGKDIENLVVSIRQQCESDGRKRSKSPPRHIMVSRRLPSRKNGDRHRRIRRRSHSPSCARSFSPENNCYRPKQKKLRSLSPIASKVSKDRQDHHNYIYSKNKSKLHHNKFNSWFFKSNQEQKAMFCDDIRDTTQVQMSTSSFSCGNYGKYFQCENFDEATALKHASTKYGVRSAFREINHNVDFYHHHRNFVADAPWQRLDSNISSHCWNLMSMNDFKEDDGEVVIFKEQKDGSWPFFCDTSDSESLSAKESSDEPGSFMVAKMLSNIRKETNCTEKFLSGFEKLRNRGDFSIMENKSKFSMVESPESTEIAEICDAHLKIQQITDLVDKTCDNSKETSNPDSESILLDESSCSHADKEQSCKIASGENTQILSEEQSDAPTVHQVESASSNSFTPAVKFETNDDESCKNIEDIIQPSNLPEDTKYSHEISEPMQVHSNNFETSEPSPDALRVTSGESPDELKIKKGSEKSTEENILGKDDSCLEVTALQENKIKEVSQHGDLKSWKKKLLQKAQNTLEVDGNSKILTISSTPGLINPGHQNTSELVKDCNASNHDDDIIDSKINKTMGQTKDGHSSIKTISEDITSSNEGATIPCTLKNEEMKESSSVKSTAFSSVSTKTMNTPCTSIASITTSTVSSSLVIPVTEKVHQENTFTSTSSTSMSKNTSGSVHSSLCPSITTCSLISPSPLGKLTASSNVKSVVLSVSHTSSSIEVLPISATKKATMQVQAMDDFTSFELSAEMHLKNTTTANDSISHRQFNANRYGSSVSSDPCSTSISKECSKSFVEYTSESISTPFSSVIIRNVLNSPKPSKVIDSDEHISIAKVIFSNMNPVMTVTQKPKGGENSKTLSSSRIFANKASSITILNRSATPEPSVGLANKHAFRGPQIKIKQKEPKIILSKPWEKSTQSNTITTVPANLSNQSSSLSSSSDHLIISAINKVSNRSDFPVTTHNSDNSAQPKVRGKTLKSILLNRHENSYPTATPMTLPEISQANHTGKILPKTSEHQQKICYTTAENSSSISVKSSSSVITKIPTNGYQSKSSNSKASNKTWGHTELSKALLASPSIAVTSASISKNEFLSPSSVVTDSLEVPESCPFDSFPDELQEPANNFPEHNSPSKMNKKKRKIYSSRSRGRKAGTPKKPRIKRQPCEELLNDDSVDLSKINTNDVRFKEGDEMIQSLLPLIKTRGKPGPKRKSSGRPRGKTKKRGRLPSISSDEDIIEELNAVLLPPSSKTATKSPPSKNESSESEAVDSDDDLVSFMGIISDLDLVVPVVPDIKQETEPVPTDDDVILIADSHASMDESEDECIPLSVLVSKQKQTKKVQENSEVTEGICSDVVDDYKGIVDEDNIFAKMEKEMKIDNSFCDNVPSISSDNAVKHEQFLMPNEENNISESAVSDIKSSASPIISENSDKNESESSVTKVESHGAVYEESQGSNPVAAQERNENEQNSDLDKIIPNMLTPPSSPFPQPETSACLPPSSESAETANSEEKPMTSPFVKVASPKNGNSEPIKNIEHPLPFISSADLPHEDAKIVDPGNLSPKFPAQSHKDQNPPRESNLIATAAVLAGVTDIVTPVMKSQDTSLLYSKVENNQSKANSGESTIDVNRTTMRLKTKAKEKVPLSSLCMPVGPSCHGFLEVCLAAPVPEGKVTYALRRIPYVRTMSLASENGNVIPKSNDAASAGTIVLPTSSTFTTYLRLRDIICLLKIHPESLFSLVTRVDAKLYYASEYARRLFSVIYDPLTQKDSLLAKMTMRHAKGEILQEFLDHTVVLDKFLHAILPKFYMEAFNIRVSDVPHFVNVKIFKPIVEINEEVVEIFRKPYEYNSFLWKKDVQIKAKALTRKRFSSFVISVPSIQPTSIESSRMEYQRFPLSNAAAGFIHRPMYHHGTGPSTTIPLPPKVMSNAHFGATQPLSHGYPYASALQLQPTFHSGPSQNSDSRVVTDANHHAVALPAISRYSMVPMHRPDVIRYASASVGKSSNELREFEKSKNVTFPTRTFAQPPQMILNNRMSFSSQEVTGRRIQENVRPQISFQNYISGHTIALPHKGISSFPPNNFPDKMAPDHPNTRASRKSELETGAALQNEPVLTGIDILAEAAAQLRAVGDVTDKANVIGAQDRMKLRSGGESESFTEVVNKLRSRVTIDDNCDKNSKKRKKETVKKRAVGRSSRGK